MPIQILMPALSPTMTQGNLVVWHKKEGDKVVAGDVLADIETDKATMEVESADAGTLARILVPAGTDHVQVNQLIGILLEAGEAVDIDAYLKTLEVKGQKNNNSPEDTSSALPAATPTPGSGSANYGAPASPVVPRTPSAKTPTSEPIPALDSPSISAHSMEASSSSPAAGAMDAFRGASPLARQLAAKRGIDLTRIQGSGPKGRVIARDVEGAAQSVRTHMRRPDVAVPTSIMRQIIAKRLVEAKQQIPHFYLNMEADMTDLLAIRASINARKRDGNKISLNDFVILAVAQALQEVPEANVSFQGETILQHGAADIAVAVSVEGGLFTPIIRGAESKSLDKISVEMRELALRARKGSLKTAEFEGGSFTISNLGMYGIASFYAIVNPPAACILGVGAVEERVVARGGVPVVRPMMTCTLSADHRAIDGKTGADFLKTLKMFLESPSFLFYHAALA